MSILQPELAQQIARSIQGQVVSPVTVLQPVRLSSERQNQLLFFFKPECFFASASKSRNYIDYVLSVLSSWEIEICGALTISSQHLAATATMDRHYGYINHISRNASHSMDEETRKSIFDLVELDHPVPIFGGHELLNANPQLTPSSLLSIWKSKPSLRARSGLYVQKFNLDGSLVVIANGFHPQQLTHFTAPGRKIVLLVLNSDLPWSFLRRRVLGDTSPDNAMAGSIRRGSLDRAVEFGLSSVSVGNNCCHMSAGPFEALFELQNFLTDAGVGTVDLKSSTLMRTLHSFSGTQSSVHLFDNLNCKLASGETISLYDLTEELDTQSAAYLVAASRLSRELPVLDC